MEIEIIKKNVYGNELMYIKDAEQAIIMQQLTGKKTVSKNDLYNLEKLGLNIIIK